MTLYTRDHLKAIHGLDETQYAHWLQHNFGALVSADPDARPFDDIAGPIRKGEHLTDDLAAIFYLLLPAERLAFRRGLAHAVATLDLTADDDRTITPLMLLLGAKICCFELLNVLHSKFLSAEAGDGASTDLQSIATDVAIELASASDFARRALDDIAISGRFRPTAVASLLLAMCVAAQDDLAAHLTKLEAALASQFGTSTDVVDDDLWVRRALLVIDLADDTQPSVLGPVVEYALRRPDWSLHWLGRTLSEIERFHLLDEEDLQDLLAVSTGLRQLTTLVEGSVPATPSVVETDWRPRPLEQIAMQFGDDGDDDDDDDLDPTDADDIGAMLSRGSVFILPAAMIHDLRQRLSGAPARGGRSFQP